MRCSRTTLLEVAPELYRNLRMTASQFQSLLEAGMPVGKRGAARVGSRGYSRSLSVAFQSVRSINLMPDAAGSSPPHRGWWFRLPHVHREAFKVLEHLCMPNEWVDTAAIAALRTNHLVIYGSSSVTANMGATPEVTYIAASNDDLYGGLDLSYHDQSKPGIRAFVIVVLPDIDPFFTGSGEEGSHTRPMPDTHSLARDISTWIHRYNTVRIVGAEHYGTMASGESLIEAYFHRENQRQRYRRKTRFIRFEDWLDEQEPGVIFTLEEEAEWRKISKEVS